MRYDHMVEKALRNVMFQAVSHVEKAGFSGDHHFYVTFKTTHQDVQISETLRTRYPEEMTIVLQHQFRDLKVNEAFFQVSLTFNGSLENLTVPFAAVIIFADPSVNFALQFEPTEKVQGTETIKKPPPKPVKKSKTPSPKKSMAPAKEKKSNVVSLDQFRKEE